MLMFAVLARERPRLFRLWLLPFLFCLATTQGNAASAASLNVKIRQLNPTSEVQQVTCTQKTKCLLPIDIQTGATKETLTVNILFAAPTVLIKFQTPKGFLYAGTTTPDNKSHYETLLPRTLTQGKTSTEDVTLYSPPVPNPFITPILDAAHEAELKIAHSAVATLEITTQPAP